MHDNQRQHQDEAPPVPDYDGLRVGEIGHRIRALTPQELAALLRYERQHADRAGVVQLIRARQAALDGGQPSPGGRGPAAPEGTSEGSAATPGPPLSPPPHGTPHQSGKPKGDHRAP
jgi:hypothetical protein